MTLINWSYAEVLMIQVDGDDPAFLYRSRVDRPFEVNHSESECIGQGSFAKMVRLAVGDPDDEVWRYAIAVAGLLIKGDQIRTYVAPSR